MTERFTERATMGGASVDRGIVRGVKVVGQTSQNGRRYTADALQGAVSRYEGVRVNIDHSDGQRRYADRFGRLANVRFENGGIFADLHFNPKHPLAEQFAWDASNSPDSLGLSHVVFGRARKVDGVDVVESIASVQSVDVVADPAAVAGLFENRQPSLAESIGDAKGFSSFITGGPSPGRSPLAERITDAKTFANYITE